ncbi:MAG: filamentous hemagglutinin N-terminal domain-containing protein [Oculatellaceae cyanobacterium bins.114]|nr:filamentous hemagglutinin N-terminal domain-containing protein [Oculatellaceae cyanobacterium bins.114]
MTNVDSGVRSPVTNNAIVLFFPGDKFAMAHSWHNGVFVSGVVLGVSTIALYSPIALAQIVPDSTLGAERSSVNRGVTVRGRLGDRIDGGALRGVNLFHSFQDFNVNEGQRVYFSNPAGVENILGRVTGRDVSDIMGTLGVDGAANLFLLNPNGILFGPNARLDIGGSFVASTGDRFTFPDGSDFSATNPQSAPLLTMRVPIGLQYGTGIITNQGQLTTGQDLTLSGNTLNLQGQLQAGRNLTLQAQDTVQIRDSVTAPFIASAGGELLIQGDRTVDIFALNHPSSGFFSGSNMTLRSANPVSGDAHYWSGGDFRIERLGGARGDLVSPYDPIILAIGDVVLGDVLNTASLHILAGGSVTLGNVDVTSIGTVNDTINPANPDPFLAALATNGIPDSVDSGTPTAPVPGVVDGANRFFVDIRAGVNWSLIPGFPGNTVINAPTPPLAGATTADIRVNSINFTGSNLGGVVYLTNQYQPNALAAPNGIVIGSIDTGGNDGGGSVTVDARSGITLNGTVITSALNLGSSGDVNFRAAGNITLNPGSRIDSSSINNDLNIPFSTVQIESTNGSVLLNNARINATNTGTRFAGDVLIDARDRIDIVNGSLIEAEGNLGQIVIGRNSTTQDDPTAPITVAIDNSRLATSNQGITGSTESFNAGDISIRATGLVSISNGAELNASTTRQGNAGDIQIDAGTGEIRIAGRGTGATPQTLLLSTVETGAIGDAGEIRVTGGSLFLTNGVQLQTLIGNGGQGDASDVNITLTGLFSADSGQIFSSVELGGGTGNSGDVSIQAGSVEIRNNSSIQAQNRNTGFAGDITIASNGQLSLTDSFVLASSNNSNQDTSPENYSEIRLSAPNSFVLIDGSRVSATNAGIDQDANAVADNGVAGDIFINARDRVSILNNSTVSAQGRFGRILIGGTTSDTIAPANVDIIDNPQDSNPDNANNQFGLIADGFAGQVRIRAQNTLQISNSRITSRVTDPADSTRDANNFGIINVSSLQGSVLIDDGSLISTTHRGSGTSGDIFINARDRVEISDRSGIFSQGYFGRITIGSEDVVPRQVLVRNNSSIRTNNLLNNDRVGGININALDLINISNSSITTTSQTDDISEGFGSIEMSATEGSVLIDRAAIDSTNFGEGLAGDISITARDSVSITNSNPDFTPQSETEFGLGIRGGISSNGRFGRIFIGASEDYSNLSPNVIRISNTRLTTDNQTERNGVQETFGRAGNIQITANRRITLINPRPPVGEIPQLGIFSETYNDQSAGNIDLSVRRGSLLLRGGFVSSRTAIGVEGDAGTVDVDARLISMNGGAQISTSTYGFGDPGNITFTGNRIALSDALVFSTIEAGAGSVSDPAQGGSITVTGRSLTMSNGAQLQTQVNGSNPSSGTRGGIGNAGTVTLDVRDLISLDGQGTIIFSNIDSGAIGNGGFISIQTRDFLMSNGAQLQTQIDGIDTNGTRTRADDRPGAIGNAGDVFIGVSRDVSLDGGGTAIFSSIGSGAIGDGGDIFVGDVRRLRSGAIVVRPTRSFAATNGAQLIASTAGRGNAGNVSLLSRDIRFDGAFESGEFTFPSAIFSGVDSGGTGQGGSVFVGGGVVFNANGTVRSLRPANSLRLEDGGLITVSTFGQGELSGRDLTPTDLTAGDVTVLSNILRLQNNGRVVARTGQGNGGNVIVGTNNGVLLMSGASRISTTAGTQRRPGNGGDITINLGEGFAIAGSLGNNDISSDAFNGAGGVVRVNAQGIISFVNRSREDIQRLLGEDAFDQIDPTSQLQTNDITAISQSDASLNGVVEINATDFDTRAIANLPVALPDASQLIARNCPSEGGQELGEFVVTGRGGLPANPNEILGSEDVLTDWVDPTDEAAPHHPSESGEPQSNLHTPIVEAQQWMMNSNGDVVLVATNPNHSPTFNPALCNARESNAPESNTPESNARETSVTQH